MTSQARSAERPQAPDPSQAPAHPPPPDDAIRQPATPAVSREIGGRAGPDPTRYGDWEIRGRCIDF